MKYTILILLFLLAGCSTSQEELMPVDPDASMLTVAAAKRRQRGPAGCAPGCAARQMVR
jgi:uncharacterized lipoprotein YajG